MTDPQSSSLLTPRTDEAERFFINPGRPPVGFVSSLLARTLEVELSRALAALARAGGQSPQPLDELALAALQAARRPQRDVLGQIDSSHPEPASPAAAQQVTTLRAALADSAIGSLRSYEAGAVLFRRGEQAENVFLLLGGQVRVSERHAGPDVVFGPGQVLGAHSLFDASLHAETVHAVGAVQALPLGADGLRQTLAADSTLLASVLMGLTLQQHRISALCGRSDDAAQSYDLLGQRTYTGPELQRELLEAKTRPLGEGLSAEQLMCLRLQALEQLPLAVVRAGQSLGQAGLDNGGSALMIVSGTVSARWGGREADLGQGSVIGLAEALSGQAFAWNYIASQDLNVRQWPVERALQQLQRAGLLWRALVGHFCAGIARCQQEAQG